MYVELNLLVGVMTFTYSPLHCFYATIMEGAADPCMIRANRYFSDESTPKNQKLKITTSSLDAELAFVETGPPRYFRLHHNCSSCW